MKPRLYVALLLGILMSTTPLFAQFAVETQNDEPMSEAALRETVHLNTYTVKDIDVFVEMNDQVAETQIKQTIHNPTRRTLEVELFFPIPEGSSVQHLTLLVDGKEMPGKLLPRDEARRIYEEIVRRKRDPALMEYIGYGLYKTSIFPVPSGEDRSIVIKYTQLATKKYDVVNYVFPFGTQKFSGKPIQNLSFEAHIKSTKEIKSVYSPSDAIHVERKTNHEAQVSFQQSNVMRTEDFRLAYALVPGEVGATVLSYKPNASEDGYFLLLASPEIKTNQREILPKSVIFVLDRSGSMAGKKLEQAKEALNFVLNNLNENDWFNIVSYDDEIATFKSELVRYSREIRQEALAYVENIRSGGGTNINEALTRANALIQNTQRPNYILFLTDGLPTAGETNEMKIATNFNNGNEHQARLFAFGVGTDVNARLLDRLSSNNGGMSVYVDPQENLETKVAEFYSGITSPVLTNLAITFQNSDVNRTYPKQLPDLFEGGQLVWVGRYTKSGKSRIQVTGKIGEENRTMRFESNLASPSEDKSLAYIEKIWATRRIGHIIDQIDLNGKNEELTKELVDLSMKYGILTPYTSFLAEEETLAQLSLPVRGATEFYDVAEEKLDKLNEVSGVAANAQRATKQGYNQASAAPAKVMAVDYEGEAREVNTIRNVGTKTFYLQNSNWVEAEIDAEMQKDAIVIKQFSDEFFELARNQPYALNQYLTFERTVILRINNQIYRIEREDV